MPTRLKTKWLEILLQSHGIRTLNLYLNLLLEDGGFQFGSITVVAGVSLATSRLRGSMASVLTDWLDLLEKMSCDMRFMVHSHRALDLDICLLEILFSVNKQIFYAVE